MTGPQPPMQWPPQPQYQPQQPPPPTLQQAPPAPPIGPAMIDPNMRIPQGDPRWPQELWGKTAGEAMQFYAIMRQEFVANRQRQQQPQFRQPLPPQQLQQPQQPQQPQPQLPGQPQPQQPAQPRYIPSGQDGSNDAIRQMIKDEFAALQQQIAPMQQVSIQSVMEGVRREFPDWDQYSLEIQQAIQGADPGQGLVPDFWRTAYYVVKGRALSQQDRGYHPQGGYPNGNGNIPAPQFGPGAVRRPDGTIVAPPPDFPGFIETPSNAPSVNGQGQFNPEALMRDPQVQEAARRWNIPVQEYVLYMNGNVPPAGGR